MEVLTSAAPYHDGNDLAIVHCNVHSPKLKNVVNLNTNTVHPFQIVGSSSQHLLPEFT